ncbi:MAG: class I tRNA ligase family protein [Caldilineaceae bacterium]
MPANEYLNLGGAKFGASRVCSVIGFNSIMREFQPDAVRYVLTAQAPETSDVEFTGKILWIASTMSWSLIGKPG